SDAEAGAECRDDEDQRRLFRRLVGLLGVAASAASAFARPSSSRSFGFVVTVWGGRHLDRSPGGDRITSWSARHAPAAGAISAPPRTAALRNNQPSRVGVDPLPRREGTSRNGWQPTADACLPFDGSGNWLQPTATNLACF